jgi:hypothetical protein
MRGGATQASVFFLVALAPAVTRGLPTHTNAVAQEDSAILWQGE